MSFLYALIKYFPFISVPGALVLVDLGIYYRRRGHPMFVACFGLCLILVTVTLLWLFFRGDLHAEAWYWALVGKK